MLRQLCIGGSLLIAGCAQQVAPTGGPIDLTPPVEIQAKTTPQNFSTRFSAGRIEIHFDEYITLKNKQQIISSPRMEPLPTYTVKGKKIIIELPAELTPNTTYSINFGSSIQDITNANALNNYRYVFSTGDYLDSLEYAGYVYDAYTSTPREDILVMLYHEDEDSIPMKRKPYYFAKTAKSGRFHIKNMQAGTYKVFALFDKNNNYLYDGADNEVGFKTDLLELQPDSAGQPLEDKIFLFADKPEKQYLDGFRYDYPGKIAMKFNRKLTAPTILFASENQRGSLYLSPRKDSAFIFLEELYTDSIRLKFTDTAIAKELSFLPKQTTAGIPPRLTYTTNLQGTRLNPYEGLVLTFSRPVSQVEKEKIRGEKDSVETVFEIAKDNQDERKLHLKSTYVQGSTYRVNFFPGAIKDIYGFVNDTLSIDFSVGHDENYGTINLSIINLDVSKHYLIQLVYGGLVYMEQSVSGIDVYKKEFPGLIPGKHELLLIEDTDGNKEWTAGSYKLKRQPEQIWRWEGGINLKPNWVQEIEWDPAVRKME